MSGGEFHVHGPHDHHVEHEGQHGDKFANRVAVMTAIFATIGAFLGYLGGATQNDALLYKNEAAIKTTKSADQWAFYQGKSNKQNLAELGAALSAGETAAKFTAEVARYKKEKDEIKAAAEKLEAEARVSEEKSAAALHVHHRYAQAMTLIQVAIALSAITILTRSRGLMAIAYGAAGAAIIVGILAAAHI